MKKKSSWNNNDDSPHVVLVQVSKKNFKTVSQKKIGDEIFSKQGTAPGKLCHPIITPILCAWDCSGRLGVSTP